MSERQTRTVESYSTSRRVIATMAVLLGLAGCKVSSDANGQPEFNHPSAAEYYLNHSDKYYQELQRVLNSTNNPKAIKNIERLQETPVAQWLNDDNAVNIVHNNTNGSRANGSIPVFVAYNIPLRDLGGDAAGGAGSAEDYREWIENVSDAIDDAPSVVVLEPDALADVPDMSSTADKEQRIVMLRNALKTFRDNNKYTAVYLDVGNSRWLPASTMADLIRMVDPDRNLVGGISLNVSYQASEVASTDYADAISSRLGYPLHVMIDNSMNGAPNTDAITGWCNPKGEKIGYADTTYSADKVETAFIKTPGESDGVCGTSHKGAGSFDEKLLLRQVS